MVSETPLLPSPSLPIISSPHLNGMIFLKLSLIGSLYSWINSWFCLFLNFGDKAIIVQTGKRPFTVWFLGASPTCSLTLCTPATGRVLSSADHHVFSPLCGFPWLLLCQEYSPPLSLPGWFPFVHLMMLTHHLPEDVALALTTFFYNHPFTCPSPQRL